MKRVVINISVSLLVLGILLWWVDLSEVAAQLRGANLGWIAAAFLALTLATWSMAHRWQITARMLGLEVSYPRALREYYLSQLVNVLLPGGVVGDISRAIRIRQTGDISRAAQSVLAERMLGQIAMCAILIAGLGAALLLPGGIHWPDGTLWTYAIALGCCIIGFFAIRFIPVVASFVALLSRLARHVVVVVHACVGAMLLLFALYACARCIGATPPPEAWVTILPLILCAMLIPLSVAGWGWREGAAAALVPLIGWPASTGVAMGVCYGAVMTLAALPALLMLPRARPLERPEQPL